MTTFIDVILEPNRLISCSLLRQCIVDTFAIGASVDQAGQIPLTQYLGLAKSDTRLIISLYDTPQTNVAMILGCELDWSPDSAIDLPLRCSDRMKLLADVLGLISRDTRTPISVLGISDGGYFYETGEVDFEQIAEILMRDIEKDCFLGKVYVASDEVVAATREAD